MQLKLNRAFPGAIRLPGRLFAFAENSIEDSVDETATLAIAVPLGYFDRFVDRDSPGGFAEDDFVDPQSHDIAVDDCHPADRPIGRVSGEERIDLSAINHDSAQQRASEVRQSWVIPHPRFDELIAIAARTLGSEIVFI